MANSDIALLVKMLPWLVLHPGASTNEVASEFHLTPRQVLRLLELVTFTGPHQYGGGLVDISLGDDDGEWITVLDAQSLDRPVKLDAREASALLAGLTYLEQMPALAEPENVGRLIDKISKALAPGEPTLSVVTAEAEREMVKTLKQALKQNKQVEITYVSGSAQNGAVRVIEPKQLSTRDDRTFVRAWCHEAEAVRSFRVDRMTKAVALHEDATVSIDSEELFADTAAWIQVQLDVDRDYLGDFDADTIVSMEDHGSAVRITAKVAHLRWLCSVVMAAAGGIRVIEPAQVRAQLHAMAQNWQALNSN